MTLDICLQGSASPVQTWIADLKQNGLSLTPCALLQKEGEAKLFPLRGTGGTTAPDLTFKAVMLNTL